MEGEWQDISSAPKDGTPNPPIDELRAALERATPGPWQMSGVRGKIIAGKRQYDYHGFGPDGVEIGAVWFDTRTGLGFQDAKLIPLAINALPDLLRLAKIGLLLDAPETVEVVRSKLGEFYEGPESHDENVAIAILTALKGLAE